MFFPLYKGVAPPTLSFTTITSFKLVVLQNIVVKETLLSKSAIVALK